jgi:methylmalonyl-CoA/ethylmalonyl-CoA epimerase
VSDVRGLRQVAIPAADVDRAVAFYRDTVGVRLVARYGDLAFFDVNGVRLLVERATEGTGASVLYLAVEDVRAARARLEARGVHFEDEPHVIFHDEDGTFGEAGVDEWMTFFRDSEGNLLALSSRERL